jgi:hypothetical protein
MYYFSQKKDEDKIDANGIQTNSEIKDDVEAILLPIF